MNKSISSSLARENFPEMINQVVYTKERIIIKRRGKAVVALVSIEDLKSLEDWEDQRDSCLLSEAVKASKGTFPLSKVIEDYQGKHKVTLKEIEDE
jgi:prevent-host-death family protein